MASRAHYFRSLFGQLLPSMPRDYMMRRRRVRAVTNFLLIALLSVLVAAAIIYSSNPSGFTGASH
jgi:hypothetical protein